MKERPILFSTPMVQAILDGRKTMTRRVMKEQPREHTHEQFEHAEWKNEKPNYVSSHFSPGEYFCEFCGEGATFERHGYKFPYGSVGDILWVRETWATERKYPNAIEEPNRSAVNYIFKADKQDHVAKLMKWKPSIFMPREACRLFLEITNIRVERLQDISEQDAVREGIEGEEKNAEPYCHCFKDYQCNDNDYGLDAFGSFATLWKSINGTESWNANPWVWVIEFKRINK